MTISMRVAAVAIAAGFVGCEPRAKSTGDPTVATSSASAPAPAPPSGAPEPLPAKFDARVHAPGADPNEYANASMENWTITGCVSDRSGACDKTTTFSVPHDRRIAFIRIWQDVRATPRCEPEGQRPGDRAFDLTYSTGKASGHLPANEADLPQRNEGPCRAHARLAMWFVRQLRERR